MISSPLDKDSGNTLFISSALRSATIQIYPERSLFCSNPSSFIARPTCTGLSRIDAKRAQICEAVR